MNGNWMRVGDERNISSPGLLLYPERIDENLRQMLAIAGGAERLRPHIKTHKIREILARQIALGITKCKCATIAEAELAATAGVSDILLAAQPVGPNAGRFAQLVKAFKARAWKTMVDNLDSARELSHAASIARVSLDVLVDLDVGQHRTGIEPGESALRLYREISKLPGLQAAGFHVYDGHIHQTDVAERELAVNEVWAQIDEMRDQAARAGMSVQSIVAGGTPTFPMHARREGVECSPGTCVLWDAGYTASFPDMDFQIAAALLARVVSKPGPNHICLDLGHKAVASEMPQPRVIFPDIPDAKVSTHNEEHLVLETALAGDLAVGAAVYGLPWHICPTVALHATAQVVRGGRVVEEWAVAARQRRINF